MISLLQVIDAISKGAEMMDIQVTETALGGKFDLPALPHPAV
jgi:hypothetical protein